MKTNEIGNDTTSTTTTGSIDTKWFSSVCFSFSSLANLFLFDYFFFGPFRFFCQKVFFRNCEHNFGEWDDTWVCVVDVARQFCSGRAMKATDEYIIIISYRDEFWIQPKYQTSHWPTHISHSAACAACAVPTNFFLLRFTPHIFGRVYICHYSKSSTAKLLLRSNVISVCFSLCSY